MIDNSDKTERLIAKLTSSLPLDALVSPQLAKSLQDRGPGLTPFQRCCITQIYYVGDEGGIVCGLDLVGAACEDIFFVSITHLCFDPRSPLAREITAYQKHRIKRIRRGPTAELSLERH